MEDSWNIVYEVIDFFGTNPYNFSDFTGPGGWADPDVVRQKPEKQNLFFFDNVFFKKFFMNIMNIFKISGGQSFLFTGQSQNSKLYGGPVKYLQPRPGHYTTNLVTME